MFAIILQKKFRSSILSSGRILLNFISNGSLIAFKIDRPLLSLYKNKNEVKKIVVFDEWYYNYKEVTKFKNEYLKIKNNYGEFKLDTTDKIDWVISNAVSSQFGPSTCYIYNKAMAKAGPFQKHDFDKIRTWAEEKGILDKGDLKTQLIKLYEEAGELSQSILKDNREDIIDAIGDCVVVLTNLAELAGVRIEDCISTAYDEISNRTGKMINGTFVKDEG